MSFGFTIFLFFADEPNVAARTEEPNRLSGRDQAETLVVAVIMAAGSEALAALISLSLPRRSSRTTTEAGGAGTGAETVAVMRIQRNFDKQDI